MSQTTEMKSAELAQSVSACELNRRAAAGCLNMCGMCPSCVLAPNPPGSTRCLWRTSDDFRRRFLVDLMSQCRNVTVLKSVHTMLGVTSWTLFNYARSRRPTSPQSSHSPDSVVDGRPVGLDLNQIWDWFNSSPDWLQSQYLFRLFSFCEPELLRMVANLTSVLLVRGRRGLLQLNGVTTIQRDSDEDSEDPALTAVPGSSKSVSGVSRYRDFISCLPVFLSKRILGLLDELTLTHCLKVCPYWQCLAQETQEEIKFRRYFNYQIEGMMKICKGPDKVSPTFASITDVPVPVKGDEREDVHPGVQKPFDAAYADVRTKTVKMEERNVYCGAYFTQVLLNKEDPHRVVDYRGGSLMVMGCKNYAVKTLHVATETTVVASMKGHIDRIRAVLHCPDRGLAISAGCDSTIRCWSLKTDKCVMTLYGHINSVNCLDVHGERLVSGGKEGLVKMWNLDTGKPFEDFNCKHLGSVRCVRINAAAVYSSCDRGLVQVWDVETASALRVIDGHRHSVKCLVFDEWHLLSGDVNGQVMAWSLDCDVKQCLMTFNHPKAVRSLALVYLRVVTGCADGKIRVFNFLTGDCLRDIAAEAETGRILSLHFHDGSILVNTQSSVTRYHFAKVFWDYKEPAEEDQDEAPPRSDLVEQGRASPEYRAQERRPKPPVILNQKATSARMKRARPRHPPTRDAVLLKVNAVQRAQCSDEASVNMERNAGLRGSWGPPRGSPDPPQRPKTCVPILKRPVRKNGPSGTQGRAKAHSAAPALQRPRVTIGPVTQLDDRVRPRRVLTQSCEHGRSERTERKKTSHQSCITEQLLLSNTCSKLKRH